MFPLLNKFCLEIENRFNPSYLKYRILQERSEIRKFLSRPDSAGNPVKENTIRNSKVTFSVVVPTYGISVEFLSDFIESIYSQSYKNWDVCICDDGDPNPKVSQYLRKIVDADPGKVKMIRSVKNEGICEATLAALKLAKNNFVVLADADDRLHPKALELFASEIFRKPDVDFLYSNHDYMTDWGLRLHPMIKPGWSPELLLHVNYINHLKVIRSDLLRSVSAKAFDPIYNGAQDWNLCFQIQLHAKRVSHIPLVLYHWRSREGSMAQSVYSKPWAVAAQWQLRKKFVFQLNPDLEFFGEQNSIEFSMQPEIDEFDLQSVYKLTSVEAILRKILNHLESSSAKYIHFGLNKRSQKELLQLTAYASLPKVGCVWPFQKNGTRTAYMISKFEQGLTYMDPICFHRSSYSNYSGNVMLGPLLGLTLSLKNAKIFLHFILTKDLPTQIRGSAIDVAGVLISAAALSTGHRNLSIANCKMEYTPGSVALPATFVPAVDPYI